MTRSLKTLVSDLAFGEAPRWREDGLYLSDIHANRVVVWRPSGRLEVVASFAGPVSGLGWLPDGRSLVVSMHDRRLLRQEPDGSFMIDGDLSKIATWHANDMVVAANGDAYVGNFGFSLETPGAFELAKLTRVTATGEVREAADDLLFPNGLVITPDGKTLIVAESGRRRLTAFDIGGHGELSNRRDWARYRTAPCPTASVWTERARSGSRRRQAANCCGSPRAAKSSTESRPNKRLSLACLAGPIA